MDALERGRVAGVLLMVLAKRMHVARGVEGEVGAGGRCMRLAREGQEREGGREEGRRSRRFIGIPFLGSASTGGRRCFSR